MSVEHVRELFAASFGGTPALVASAPARVNLIGEHTDYNGGEVLPIAIARRTYVALRPIDGNTARTVSATEEGRGSFDVRAPERASAWSDYLAGVVREMVAAGVRVPAFEAAVWSDVPAGAGLSSSAALEVATAVGLYAACGTSAELRDVALLGQRAENQFVGVNSGIMDQFASALGRKGHALHVWCDTAETEQVPMDDAVLIFDTAVPRSLRGSAYNERRRECDEALALLQKIHPNATTLAQLEPEQIREAGLPAVLADRATHVSAETRRVRATVAVLKAGGAPPGDLLLASHASLRDLYACSSAELDWFVERAMREPGVRGARLTGAGWGGCAIAVGERDALEAAAPAIAADYASAFKRDARTWITDAQDGARVDDAGAFGR